jgi:hypothetical protein
MEVSMNQEFSADFPSKAKSLFRSVRGWVARLPKKALIVLGLFLFAAVLLALHTALTRKDSSLRLKVQHSFRSAQLSVWLDGDLAYSGKLIGSSRKRLGFFESVQGSLSETFNVSSGAHVVRVRVVNSDGSAQENTIRGEFTSSSQRTLSVVARGDDVSMNWLGDSSGAVSANPPANESQPPSAGWFQRYAGSVLLSIVGSIMSACTGYAIRELPKKIASRQAETAKAQSAAAGR